MGLSMTSSLLTCPFHIFFEKGCPYCDVVASRMGLVPFDPARRQDVVTITSSDCGFIPITSSASVTLSLAGSAEKKYPKKRKLLLLRK